MAGDKKNSITAMPTYFRGPARKGRPKEYGDLLAEYMNPALDASDHLPHWAVEHANQPRFYVSGFNEFTEKSQISDTKSLVDFQGEALKMIQKSTKWTTIPQSKKQWANEGLSYNQFRFVKRREPIYLQKAAFVLGCCEIAMREQIKAGEALDTIQTATDIYQFMAIVPAAWNIDKLNKNYVEAFRRLGSQAAADLAAATHQRTDLKVLDDLAKGMTVTRRTAARIKAYLDTHHPGLNGGLGDVRCTAGKRILGQKKASLNEMVEGL